MVRSLKRFWACVGLVLAICVSMATQAHAYTIYDGSISTTYLTYFRDILLKYDVSSDYVLFRSNQYTYTLVVGDLEYSAGTITSIGEVSVCNIYQDGNYNSTYNINTGTETSFTLEVGTKFIYSNLHCYPTLTERGDNIAFTTLFVICVMCLCFFIRGLFEWRKCLRNG